LQTEYIKLLAMFSIHCSPRIWSYAQVLITGAILTRGQRTVTAVLRVMGLGDERHFVNYHRVLQRAVWSSLAVSGTLLFLLIQTFVPTGPLLIGGDDTIERRWGRQIAARGIYRDPVRSSQSHFVKASGLRWLTLMLLVPVPFAERVWALPFLTLLAPSERYYEKKGRPPKKLTDWLRQALLQVRRWVPHRAIVFVADSSYAVIDLLASMAQLTTPITMVVRFRLDAALYEPVAPRQPGQLGRTRKKGARLPTLAQVIANPYTRWQRQVVRYWYGEPKRTIEITSGTAVWFHGGHPAVPIRWVIVRDPLGKFKTQALLCTDLQVKPPQVVEWFVQRWQLEVTFRDVREHLGVETQRQWSALAIARTTPALLGLYSLITVLAHRLAQRGKVFTRRTAWYRKPRPTFSDAIASVRYELWRCPTFHTSQANRNITKLPTAVLKRLASALCYST
jgi:DDE superfamily endonuclease